ncbi:DMT family transporter [Nocardioides sp. URHA0020]|uniref:DMT family transporter n=1 Tax=Nocardioides sp. URHA0020 TaxID=1380392 RepID=UPI0006865C73|nr:DMT family transporter [Nocardioides sp. URHA0020]
MARLSTTPRAGVGLLQICLAGVLWGTGGLGVQAIRDVVPMSVLTISAWRMAIAAVVLLVVLLSMRQLPSLVALARAHPGRVALVGCGTAAYQALYFGAIVAVGVSVSTVVSLGLAPVLLTVEESLRHRTAPARSQVLVLVVALTGLVLVSLAAGSRDPGPHPTLGVVLAAASGATYAATTAFGRSLAQVTGPLTLTTATTSVGAVALLPTAFIGGSITAPLTEPVVAVTVLYLGVFTMAIAYGLLYAGLRTTTGSAAVIATLLEPVTAAALAAVLLDERLGVVGIVGTALILLAVAGLGRREETTTGVVSPAP